MWIDCFTWGGSKKKFLRSVFSRLRLSILQAQVGGRRSEAKVRGQRGAKSGEVFSRLEGGGWRAEGGGGRKGKFLLPFGDAPF